MDKQNAGKRPGRLFTFLFSRHRNGTLNAITTAIAIGISLVLAILLIMLVSADPANAIYQFLIGPLSSKRQLGNILTTAATISYTGIAVCIMFQASMFNMAAEGACFLGGLAGAIVASSLDLPPVLCLVLPMLAGMIVGGIIGLIPGLLRAKLNANEMVSSLMLNYAILYFGLYILKNFFIDKSAGQVATAKLAKASRLPNLIKGTGVHGGVILVIFVIVLAYVFLYKTRSGHHLRVYGQNANFARYTGIGVGGVIVSSQVLGGAVAGLGGAVEIMGMYQRFQWTALPGYGWDGIIIAILARNKPQFVPLAALFIAYLRTGANCMNTYADVPKELITVIQAIMMILVTAEALTGGLKQKIAIKEALSNDK